MTSRNQLLTATGVLACTLLITGVVEAHGGPFVVGMNLALYIQRGALALAVVTYQ